MQARGRYHDLYVQQSLRESSRALDGWDSDAPEPAAG
jgi:hypothetical protein